MYSSEATSSVNNNRFRKTVYMFIFPLAGVILRLNLECSCFLWHTSFELLLSQCLCHRFSLFVCSVFFMTVDGDSICSSLFQKARQFFSLRSANKLRTALFIHQKKSTLQTCATFFKCYCLFSSLSLLRNVTLKYFLRATCQFLRQCYLGNVFFATKFQD